MLRRIFGHSNRVIPNRVGTPFVRGNLRDPPNSHLRGIHKGPRPACAPGPTALEPQFVKSLATSAGTDAERLVKDAALRLLQEDARFRAAVREGIAQADRGEFIEEEEMDARLEQMLRS